jgi:hypothetical protein
MYAAYTVKNIGQMVPNQQENGFLQKKKKKQENGCNDF